MSQAHTIATPVTSRTRSFGHGIPFVAAGLSGLIALAAVAAVLIAGERSTETGASSVTTMQITPAIQAVQDGWEVSFRNAQAAMLERAQSYQDGWEVTLRNQQAAMLERAQGFQDGWEVKFRNAQASLLERAQAVQDGWEIRLLR
jgi:hypothetical protein